MLPESFDFFVGDEFAAPGLSQTFEDGGTRFVVGGNDGPVPGSQSQDGNRNGVLASSASSRSLAMACSSSLVMRIA